MTQWNEFRGTAKRLDDIDLPRIGARINVGEDEIHAFMDVETSGTGFDSSGRPKILFEPHVFYRNLSGSKRDLAVAKGLAYKSWGSRPYPKDSYPRLKEAILIDETAALRSASWGLGQILGENHQLVGYATVQEMVLHFMEDEEYHLEAIVQFLISTKIDDDLRAHRWDTVARVYNGASYKKNDYANKMARAYTKWSRIKDTPWSPEVETTETIVVQPSPVPVATDDGVRPTPVQQANKAVAAGTGSLGGLSFSAALLTILAATGIIPVDSMTPEVSLAMGVVVTGFVQFVTSTVATYRAKPNGL